MERLGENSKLPPRQMPRNSPPTKNEGGSSISKSGQEPINSSATSGNNIPPPPPQKRPNSAKDLVVKNGEQRIMKAPIPTPPPQKTSLGENVGKGIPSKPNIQVGTFPPKKMPSQNSVPQRPDLPKMPQFQPPRGKGPQENEKESLPPKLSKNGGGDKPKTESEKLDDEEDIEELEKSYKVALSDKEKQRKRKKRKLLLLLLLLFLLIGSIIGTYFIIKSKEDQFIPEFNDNVNVRLSDYEILKTTKLHPADKLSLSNHIHIGVPDSTLENYADIVAFAIKISFNFVNGEELLENCNDKFYVLLDHADEIYGIENFETYTTTSGEVYYKIQQNQLIYYTRILMPGSSMSLVKGFLVGPDEVQNDSAEKTIRITLTAWGVFPSIEKILDDPESYLKGAPRKWAEMIQDKAKVIFDSRRGL